MNTAAKGRNREKAVMAILRAHGWCPLDSRGSHGIDIRAWRQDGDDRYLAISVGGKGKTVLAEFLKLSVFLNDWAGGFSVLRRRAIPLVVRLKGRKWEWFPYPEAEPCGLLVAEDISRKHFVRGGATP